jgi:hypothetical protein
MRWLVCLFLLAMNWLVCLSWSAKFSPKESPLVDQAHPPHPGQPLGLPVPLHPLLLSPYPLSPSRSSCNSSPYQCHSLKQECVAGSDGCTADSSSELGGDDGQLILVQAACVHCRGTKLLFEMHL